MHAAEVQNFALVNNNTKNPKIFLGGNKIRLIDERIIVSVMVKVIYGGYIIQKKLFTILGRKGLWNVFTFETINNPVLLLYVLAALKITSFFTEEVIKNVNKACSLSLLCSSICSN